MVIGLKYGYTSPDDTQGKEKAYALVREFAKQFKERNDSTICEELLGTHMVTGDRELAASNLSAVCPKMVRDAAEILESIL
jgi:C_GCAxxG_C_C family probable redox protein